MLFTGFLTLIVVIAASASGVRDAEVAQLTRLTFLCSFSSTGSTTVFLRFGANAPYQDFAFRCNGGPGGVVVTPILGVVTVQGTAASVDVPLTTPYMLTVSGHAVVTPSLAVSNDIACTVVGTFFCTGTVGGPSTSTVDVDPSTVVALVDCSALPTPATIRVTTTEAGSLRYNAPVSCSSSAVVAMSVPARNGARGALPLVVIDMMASADQISVTSGSATIVVDATRTFATGSIVAGCRDGDQVCAVNGLSAATGGSLSISLRSTIPAPVPVPIPLPSPAPVPSAAPSPAPVPVPVPVPSAAPVAVPAFSPAPAAVGAPCRVECVPLGGVRSTDVCPPSGALPAPGVAGSPTGGGFPCGGGAVATQLSTCTLQGPVDVERWGCLQTNPGTATPTRSAVTAAFAAVTASPQVRPALTALLGALRAGQIGYFEQTTCAPFCAGGNNGVYSVFCVQCGGTPREGEGEGDGTADGVDASGGAGAQSQDVSGEVFARQTAPRSTAFNEIVICDQGSQADQVSCFEQAACLSLTSSARTCSVSGSFQQCPSCRRAPLQPIFYPPSTQSGSKKGLLGLLGLLLIIPVALFLLCMLGLCAWVVASSGGRERPKNDAPFAVLGPAYPMGTPVSVGTPFGAPIMF